MTGIDEENQGQPFLPENRPSKPETTEAPEQEVDKAPPFNKEQASYGVSTFRLKIACGVIAGLLFLILISMGLLACLAIDDKREILSALISGLFSALMLTIGFVAGSSIDNK